MNNSTNRCFDNTIKEKGAPPMQKTSKTEAEQALARIDHETTALGVLPRFQDLATIREFIDASPDTGEAVAWMARRVVSVQGEYGDWAFLDAEPFFGEWNEVIPLFTHPVTPEGWTDPNAPIRKDLEALISQFEDGNNHDSGAFDSDCPTCRILEELRDMVSRDYDRYDQPAQPDLSASGGAQGLEWLVSALVSKTSGPAVTYGHHAAIIKAENESEAKGQALDKFLVDGYSLESIDLKRVTSPLSQASDTVAVSREDAEWIEKHMLAASEEAGCTSFFWAVKSRLRASMEGK